MPVETVDAFDSGRLDLATSGIANLLLNQIREAWQKHYAERQRERDQLTQMSDTLHRVTAQLQSCEGKQEHMNARLGFISQLVRMVYGKWRWSAVT